MQKNHKKEFRCRMVWNELHQKWLMQKYNKIAREWVFIYDFWDCGNVKILFDLHKKDDKKFPQHYKMVIQKVKE